MTEPQVKGVAGVKKKRTLLLLHDCSCLFVIWQIDHLDSIARSKELALHTIDEHLHVVQHFCRRHLHLFLCQFVQPLQSILNVVPA